MDVTPSPKTLNPLEYARRAVPCAPLMPLHWRTNTWTLPVSFTVTRTRTMRATTILPAPTRCTTVAGAMELRAQGVLVPRCGVSRVDCRDHGDDHGEGDRRFAEDAAFRRMFGLDPRIERLAALHVPTSRSSPLRASTSFSMSRRVTSSFASSIPMAPRACW